MGWPKMGFLIFPIFQRKKTTFSIFSTAFIEVTVLELLWAFLFLFQVSNAYLQRDLFSLEKQERAMNLKFGVIYAKSGQLTDDEVI